MTAGVPEAAPPRVRATAWWPLLLVAVGGVALAAGLAIVDGMPAGVVADDAMYVILAKSIASGQGYRFLNVPGLPHATHFPPGYPAVLALLSLAGPAFPASVVLFKAMNAVFLAASAVLVARFARDRVGVGPAWALGAGVATAVSVPLLILGSMVLSELLFLALLLALLPALERLLDDADDVSVARMLLLGVGIAACTLVRTHGVVLVPAVALLLGVRRRWRDAMLVTGSAVLCLLPWQLWTMRHGGVLPEPLLGMYDSYGAWWIRGLRRLGPSMISDTLARTIPETTVMLSVLFSPVRSPVARSITLAALALLAAAGVAASWRRVPVTLLALAGYLVIVLIWPFQTARFVWGVWPLLLLLLLVGGRAAFARPAWPRALRAALAVSLCWVAAGYAAYELRAVRGRWWSSIARVNAARLAPMVHWAAANTAPGEVVASEYEGAVYLYAGRQALPVASLTPDHYLRDVPARENALEGLLPVLEAYPVRTVIVGHGKSLDAASHLAAQPRPRLGLREPFPGGATFTVLRP